VFLNRGFKIVSSTQVHIDFRDVHSGVFVGAFLNSRLLFFFVTLHLALYDSKKQARVV